MQYFLLLTALCLALSASAQEEKHIVRGTVYADEEVLAGASVSIRGTSLGTVTDAGGKFLMELPAGNYTLVVSFIGYQAFEKAIDVPLTEGLSVSLEADATLLSEVTIVSTGYQKLPEERATGSFVQVEQELVDRRVSANIMDRIEDVTPGVLFNRDVGGRENDITIRGTNTIFADARPLIVIDNFPYDGPLENINPNDVESITVLKDAAAASIWGARAGNGVIVITTKSGMTGTRITFNTFASVREKPDLYYNPQMEIADFIDIEQDLFEQGVYNSRITSRQKPALSPVVETLIALRDGFITEQEANERIAYYKTVDTRDHESEHFYRPSVNQQYSLSLAGGGQQHGYTLSAGYDKGIASLKGNDNSRLTLNARNDWRFADDKLQLSAGLYLVRSKAQTGSKSLSGTLAPYTPLVDEMGNPLPVNYTYSERFVNQAEEDGLINWRLNPVEEIGLNDHTTTGQDVRLNTSLGYEFLPGLKGEVLYQYWMNDNTSRLLYPEESFYARDIVNMFSAVPAPGTVERVVPEGGILDLDHRNSSSHNLRGIVRYDRNWKDTHRFNGLAGFEVKDFSSESNSTRYYGYDDELGLSSPVDYTTRYRRYHNNSLAYIPDNNDHSGIIDRFVSYYINAAYTYSDKYIFSASARKDASNLFGVDTNQKGVPLWSAGLGWIINKESFYNVGWLPYLKFRATYGYNGNTVKNVTAYPTALYRSNNSVNGLPYAQITNPPNPELQWERIKLVNTGIDFSITDDVISGSIEVYWKRGLDLIGNKPYPSSTGITAFMGNYANTETWGMDLVLHTRNIRGAFEWTTNFMYSHVKEEVTHYEDETITTEFVDYGSGGLNIGGTPYVGRPLYGIYSYPWAGLDPDTGDPIGYVDGEQGIDYTAIVYNTLPEDLRYHGSGRPVSFGAVHNNLSWKNLSLSFNITYRLGYFFRRNSIDYEDLLQGRITHADYYGRWQQPGDENITDIPSMPAARNANRNIFYTYSAALVEPGDHIRLQDIRLGYTLNNMRLASMDMDRIEIYVYASNIGLIWKKTEFDIDPDYLRSKPLQSVAMGIKLDL